MKRLTSWQFGLLVLGAVALGVVMSVVIGSDRRDGGERTEPASSVVLADPLDPPQKGVLEPRAEARNAAASSDPHGAEGDRAKLTWAKERLKAKVIDGGASDSERRMLKALCRQLGDQSCAD